MTALRLALGLALTLCTTFFITIPTTLASSGDYLPAFQQCMYKCDTPRECARQPADFFLHLFRWSCTDRCRYDCMHLVATTYSTARADATASSRGGSGAPASTVDNDGTASGAIHHQFFGKWPFHRLLGMQEPCSVLFSLLNLYAQFQHWRLARRWRNRGEAHAVALAMRSRWTRGVGRVIGQHHHVASASAAGISAQPMSMYLGVVIVNLMLAMNAWLWSTVFHVRDVPWTERMDYFSAMASILMALYYAVYRTLELDRRPRIFTHLLTLAALTFFTMHIRYLLSRPRFDYGYNVQAGLVVAVLHHLFWLGWAWTNRGRAYTRWCVVGVVWVAMAMSLEILDFPPWWGAVDAHALWHLATVPAAYIWNYFVFADLRMVNEERGELGKLRRLS